MSSSDEIVDDSSGVSTSTVEPEDQITYSWKNVNVTSFPKVTGIAKPGELIALMGASGAGKSTLLNCLTFHSSRKLLITGEIRINGLYVDERMMKFVSAYVQQHDIFLGNLTVMEHLQFAAKVIMNRRTTKVKRALRIEELLNELNLTKCQQSRIGIPGKKKGISGGEMKRLAFATALLNNPPMLFCDEPTSGLDSFMSKNVVQMMKKISSQGRSIVTTIHQPSTEIFYMFDKVMFLTEGKVAFFGTPDEANRFFASVGAQLPPNHNPAEYFIFRLATKYEDPVATVSQSDFLDNTTKKYAESNYAKKVLKDIDDSVEMMQQRKNRLSVRFDALRKLNYQQSWCVQFRALLVRTLLDTMKSRELVTMKFIQNVIVALMFGVLYWDQQDDQDAVFNINGALFISVMNLSLQNTFSVIHVLIDELPVFLREHAGGMYRTDAYYISKTIVELPLQIFFPVMYVSIMYYMIGLNPNPMRFLWHCTIATLCANIGNAFGYFLGITTTDLSVALNTSIPVIIPLILFSGYMLNIDTITTWLSWIHYLSWFFYSNEALIVTQWDGVKNISCTRPNTVCPPNGETVIAQFSYKVENFGFDITMMLVILLSFRIFALLLLQLRVVMKD